jgi:hypothetical protein
MGVGEFQVAEHSHFEPKYSADTKSLGETLTEIRKLIL